MLRHDTSGVQLLTNIKQLLRTCDLQKTSVAVCAGNHDMHSAEKCKLSISSLQT